LIGVAVDEPPPCPAGTAAQLGAVPPRTVSAAAPARAPRLLIAVRLPVLAMLVPLRA
jgi:hypothetical protein